MAAPLKPSIGPVAPMSERALVLHEAEPFQVPAIIADVGPEATKRFFEFFTVPIRNKNTRMAYYRAIGQFLDWCQRAGFRNLEDIEPIHVAATSNSIRVQPRRSSSTWPQSG